MNIPAALSENIPMDTMEIDERILCSVDNQLKTL